MASVPVGANTTYTITVTNNGPDPASNSSMTDPLPAGMTFVSLSSPGGWSCITPAVGANGTISCTNPGLAVGSYVFTLVAKVGAAVPVGTLLVNTASAASATADPNSANNSATDSDTAAAPLVDVSLVKAGPATVSSNGAVSYTLTITNAGPGAADGTTVTDPVVANFTASSVACGSVIGGAVCPVAPTLAALQGAGIAIPTLPASGSLIFTVSGTAAASGTIANLATATVPASVVDTAPGNNTSTANTSITATVTDLTMVKNGPASVVGNGALSYTLVVTNNGPAAADGAVVRDASVANFTASSVSCGSVSGGAVCPVAPTVLALQGAGILVPTLPANGSLTFTVSGTAAASGSIANTATVTAPAGIADTNPANNGSTASTAIAASIADLSVQKGGPSQVTINGQVIYSIQVVNLGPGSANGATVTDTVPAGLVAPQLTTCTASGGASCPAVIYPVAVVGPFTIPVLPAGGAVTLTIVGTAPGVSGDLTNSVSVAPPAGTSDPTPANNTSQVSTQVVISPQSSTQADLGIIKSGPAAVGVAGVVTYTIIISNAGPAAADGAVVTDTVPLNLVGPALTACTTTGGATCPAVVIPAAVTGPWTLPALPAGATVTLTIAGTAPAAVGNLTNVINVAPPAGITDPDVSNNTAQADTTVLASPPSNNADVLLTKTGPGTVGAGALVTYTLTLTNLGPDAADGTVITDTVPAALIAPQLATCVAAGGAACPAVALPQAIVGTLDVTVPTLPLNGTVTLTVTGTAPSINTSFTNLAQADPPLTVSDPNLENNVGGPVTTGVLAAADLVITKSDGVGSVVAGGATSYIVTVTNNGPAEVTGATVIDTAPAGMTIGNWTCVVSNPGVGGSVITGCGAANGSGNFSVAVTMKAGAVITFTVPATISPAASGSIANTATVIAPGNVTDLDPTNNSATDTDAITAAPIVADLSITKSDGGNNVNAGGSTVYTITVSNNGPSSVTGAILADPVTAGPHQDRSGLFRPRPVPA